MSDIVNRVRVLAPSATGTSSAALGSAYSAKYLTPAEAGCIDGRRYTWLIEQGNDVELVEGAWASSGNTAARTKVIFSKISGSVGTSKINLNGTAVISIVQAAEDMGSMRGSRTVTGSSDTIAATDLNRPIIYNRGTAIAVSIGQAGDTGSFIEGWLTWVQNKGAGAVTITPATSTIDSAATLVLQQNQGAMIWSDGTHYQSFRLGNIWDGPTSLTATQQTLAQKNIGIPTLLRGYLAGLTVSPASSTSLSISAGVAVDSTNADAMTLATTVTKSTSAWAVGSGNGALDTGTIASSTTYHLFLIKRPDTGVVDVLLSLSATAPTLPTNYTLFRRIFSMITNGSAQWSGFTHVGDQVFWQGTRTTFASGTISATASLIALSVPTGIVVAPMMRAIVPSGQSNSIIVTSIVETDEAPGASYSTSPGFDLAGSTGQVQTSNFLLTNTSAQIRARGDAGSLSLAIHVRGWIDRRGRDG